MKNSNNVLNATFVKMFVIIAILVVSLIISVPTFISQMSKYEKEIDITNLEFAISMASADYNRNKLKGTYYYSFDIGDQGIVVASGYPTSKVSTNAKTLGNLQGHSVENESKSLLIMIENNEVSAEWTNRIP